MSTAILTEAERAATAVIAVPADGDRRGPLRVHQWPAGGDAPDEYSER